VDSDAPIPIPLRKEVLTPVDTLSTASSSPWDILYLRKIALALAWVNSRKS
jgi:hypothetical protein